MNPNYAVALDQGLGKYGTILAELRYTLRTNNRFLCYYPALDRGRPSVHWVHGSAIALGLELKKSTENYKRDEVMVFRMHKGTLRLMSKNIKNNRVKGDMVYTIRDAEGATDAQLCDAIEKFCREEPHFVKLYNRENLI
ncbi:hypothetical protein COCVIDRAFT_116071 [Bipolaris victoriae FI3]|uniref:Uncharacterized protein n=1 Tax=Bipolaris victoriae (strain FI3) TaxID=930091 RepID=W7DXB9_BIPV3|nr:hypothetical protein COCVIDRAFT_116071 [Bipolaris victoriae FI3]